MAHYRLSERTPGHAPGVYRVRNLLNNRPQMLPIVPASPASHTKRIADGANMKLVARRISRVVATYLDGANMTVVQGEPGKLLKIITPTITITHIIDSRHSTPRPLYLREKSPASFARQKRWKCEKIHTGTIPHPPD